MRRCRDVFPLFWWLYHRVYACLVFGSWSYGRATSCILGWLHRPLGLELPAKLVHPPRNFKANTQNIQFFPFGCGRGRVRGIRYANPPLRFYRTPLPPSVLFGILAYLFNSVAHTRINHDLDTMLHLILKPSNIPPACPRANLLGVM